MTQGEHRSKAIVLFSDGTGNSSGKLFKTNVWRLYEALDLGPNAQGRRVQIAYYDNGVGTSSFRPFALLGGLFGFGLKGGVLRIYRYLCRNYQPGDKIYAFGFSRGAFTIRLLVALICAQGIVRATDEGDLAAQARGAYRELCRGAWPNKPWARFFSKIVRWARDGVVAAKRGLFRQRAFKDVPRHYPMVEFVGVWDTVAAYGGPIAEITRGVDDLVWPLTMPNYALSVKVRRASHALALDDERDAFMPLLWDEYRERELVKTGMKATVDEDGRRSKGIVRPAPDRLNQVWFTGMHSDVGGGYPDESLSYVSLLWMIDEVNRDAAAADQLRFLDRYVGRMRDVANPYGPIHDSRAGIGSYYRYQPRNIEAWMPGKEKKDLAATMSFRDPEIAGRDAKHKRCKDRGLLTSVKVHESVIARIASGTDCYAPVALPDAFEVVYRDPEGHSPAYLSVAAGTAFVHPRMLKLRAEKAQAVWDTVWVRRKIYFATVIVSLALALLPVWTQWWDPGELADPCGDDRCLAPRPILWLGQFIPYGEDWVEGFATYPFAFALLVLVLATLLAAGHSMGANVRDRSRQLWNLVTGASKQSDIKSGWLTAFRRSARYQRPLRLLRWHILPLLSGTLVWLVILYSTLAVATQAYLILAEPRAHGCAEAEAVDGAYPFSTNQLCTSLPVKVTDGEDYRITLEIGEDWKDVGAFGQGTYPVTAPGAKPKLPWYLDRPGQAFRRVMTAEWLEPLVRIRWQGRMDHVFVTRLELSPVPGEPKRYAATIEAQRSGEVDIFVNDARLPFDGGLFYDHNAGTATIAICRLSKDGARDNCLPPAEVVKDKAPSASVANAKLPRPDTTRLDNHRAQRLGQIVT